MNRLLFTFFLFAFWISSPAAHGQFVVHQDEQGQVITTFDTYTSNVHNQVTYLGSPFLTYPVWQPGKIQMDTNGQEIVCELAYNLLTNEVLCRFAGDSAVKIITPELFTINGTEFIRQQNKLLGVDYRIYYTELYSGPTKLLMTLSSQLESRVSSNNGYTKQGIAQGIYQTKAKYYLQKGDVKPELISLTKKTLLAALHEQSEKISTKLSAKELTRSNVMAALREYDSLMAVDRASQLPLMANPLFSRVLHNNLIYPDFARNQGVYGRVYGGFEIDAQGNVKNVVLLSPDNVGFKFDIVVKSALEKLSRLNPELQGKYALPVAFTYTNTKDRTTGPHVPVNYLSPDRLEGRTVLEEFVVSSTVSKSSIDSIEVWGYFK